MPIQSIQLNTVYSIQIFDTIDKIGEEQWNAVNKQILFYQTYSFLKIIEELHQSIAFRYVLVYKEHKIIAALYTQRIYFPYKNLTHYSNEEIKGIKGFLKNYFSQKYTYLLNLGNVFFTGDKGIICTNEEDVLPHVEQIFNSVKASFAVHAPKTFLLSNVYKAEDVKCMDLCRNGFHPFVTEPDLFLQVRPHWHSYTDYLNSLSSKYRIRANKVLAVSQDIEVKNLSLEEIKNHKKDITRLYTNVVNHVAFNMAALNIEFFEVAKKIYGSKCMLLGYYKNSVMVGFAFIFNVDDYMLHVHYIGLDYTINQQQKLYNRMLLDFVRMGIEQKKPTIHFGRTATEIKTTIGAYPVPLQAYIKMSNPMMNAVIPYILERIKPPEYTIRNPFKEVIFDD
ncbi:MAG: peptidogalycan biosysnthesis protein [Chitinophagales bacterium]|nr:peptidogalycan biosysnthesis protein [Chitinophagales bacterium]